MYEKKTTLNFLIILNHLVLHLFMHLSILSSSGEWERGGIERTYPIA